MPLSFVWLEDTKNRPRVRKTREGTFATRIGRVTGTADPVEALTAGPAIGDSWSPSLANLVVASVEPELERARDVVGSLGVTGSCLLRVEYAPPPMLPGSDPIPREDRLPGKAYSSFDSGETSVNVRTDIEGRLIADGQGVGVSVPTATLTVVAYSTSGLPLALLLQLRGVNGAQVVNANTVAIPAQYGTTETYSAEPGQLRLVSWRQTGYDDETEAHRLEYTFALAPDHFVRWANVDADGQAVGPIVASTVYEAKTFPQLWGTP
jgi:hypothetical protein